MLTCPMCKKALRGLEKECGSCRTDVSLLVDYVFNLQDGLTRAEFLTRAGELDQAVWTYLEVLETDPDNQVARKQVGKVATAVRQFDMTAQGRRWARGLQKRGRFRRWLSSFTEEGEMAGCMVNVFWLVLVICSLFLGYALGRQSMAPPTAPPGQSQPAEPNPANGPQ